jgi:bifunctional non-homologous end joining protein LigD
VLVVDGDDLRQLPLSMRKANLERLLARRPGGIFINPFERGEIGPDLFFAACRMGLESLGFETSRPLISGLPLQAIG